MVRGKSGEEEDEESDNDEAKNFAVLLYDVAALTSGYEIEDSGDFAGRIMSVMKSKSSVSSGGIKDAEVETTKASVAVVEEQEVEDKVEGDDADIVMTTEATKSGEIMDAEVETPNDDKSNDVE
jgi:heat shock protein beta